MYSSDKAEEMAPAIYLFFVYLISLSYGQLDISSPVSNTVTTTLPGNSAQSHLETKPSIRASSSWNQPSSSKHTFRVQLSPSGPDKSTIPLSYIGQPTTVMKPSNQGNNLSTVGALSKLSLKQSATLTQKYSTSGLYVSNKPSKQLTLQHSGSVTFGQSGQLLTTTTTPLVIGTTVPQHQSSLIVKINSPSSILVTRTVFPTTSTKQSVSAQNYSNSTVIFVSSSPAIQTSSNNITNETPRTTISILKPNITSVFATLSLTSTPKVILNQTSVRTTGLISSSNVILRPSPSQVKLNLMSSSSEVILKSSQVLLNITSSPLTPNITSVPAVLSSTNVILIPTSSKVKLNQTSSSAVIPHPSSAQLMPNLTSTPTMPTTSSKIVLNPTSASKVVLTLTSSPIVLNATVSNVVKSIISSAYLTLQPSSTMQYKPTRSGNTISSSPPFFIITNTTMTTFISNSTSGIGMKTSSVVLKSTTAPGSQDKEKSHTPLIIGLAVGLSLGMVLIIVIIVYYRRKRSSYQYNVFYDEQNIVMHPFDYSK